jgi:dienelactone hydrolase
LCDLLSKAEEREDAYTGHLRFDIGFLAKRLNEITDKLTTARPELLKKRLGFFGASTGGGAAILAAVERKRNQLEASAVVSRGGRPDLSPDAALHNLKTPTLLLVGGEDHEVIDMNKTAFAKMRALGEPAKKLTIVPGATHLFEEPGTLDEVARLATEWFSKHLLPSQGQQPATSSVSTKGTSTSSEAQAKGLIHGQPPVSGSSSSMASGPRQSVDAFESKKRPPT